MGGHTSVTLQTVLEYADAHQTDNLNHLIEFLRIPSISTLPSHRPDMQRAADWLMARMEDVGLRRVHRIPTDLHSVVYGEWTDAGRKAPTLLVYGHYDVQPTDPDEKWTTPPFEPTIRGGDLYARGASDDKGQHYTHLAAAEAFLRTQNKLPVNLKFFIEGQEECGSAGLVAVLERHSDLLACDAVVISDDSFWNATTPKIGTGTRGIAYFEVDIRGPRQDLHSGTYGGAVHNPLQVAAEMVAGLHDAQGRVAIPGFYDRVRPISDDEREEWDRVPFDEEQFRRDEVGAPALWAGEAGYSVRERITTRPTLEVHSIQGGILGEGQKTVIPARAVVKMSMRLVPDQDPLEVARLFEHHIQQIAPPTVHVTVHTLSHAHPSSLDRRAPAVEAAVEAYRLSFGAEPIFLRMGGSIPVMADLMRILGAPVVMMGFGLPDDNLHAPNEKLSLACFYRGIHAAIHFMDLLGRQ
jgi:acetylornithine deacetylase/succinyl-diaminopimelate desuccinylase-like protein